MDDELDVTESCFYCPKSLNLQWSAVWDMWLCQSCRSKRTQAELRYDFTPQDMADYMKPKSTDGLWA